MLQFLTYLLHKPIIEMRRSQNLRCPFLVPSRRLWPVARISFLSNTPKRDQRGTKEGPKRGLHFAHTSYVVNMSKIATSLGRFQFFFQCLALPKDPQSFGILIRVLQAYVVNMSKIATFSGRF